MDAGGGVVLHGAVAVGADLGSGWGSDRGEEVGRVPAVAAARVWEAGQRMAGRADGRRGCGGARPKGSRPGAAA